MARLISSTPSGNGWIQYALHAAKYGAQLRALGLGYFDPERICARKAIQEGIRRARKERRQYNSARRIVRALAIMKTKKALAAA